MTDKITKSETEWMRQLTPEQYRVTRLKGTEPPFSGKLCNSHRDGSYHCVCCGTELFDSSTKFDSGSGWPSFSQPADGAHVKSESDESHGMIRTEVMCDKCDAHLGHVFEDGPQPTGLRYCINSASLKFSGRE